MYAFVDTQMVALGSGTCVINPLEHADRLWAEPRSQLMNHNKAKIK